VLPIDTLPEVIDVLPATASAQKLLLYYQTDTLPETIHAPPTVTLPDVTKVFPAVT
jgi:hypothetical protein